MTELCQGGDVKKSDKCSVLHRTVKVLVLFSIPAHNFLGQRNLFQRHRVESTTATVSEEAARNIQKLIIEHCIHACGALCVLLR